METKHSSIKKIKEVEADFINFLLDFFLLLGFFAYARKAFCEKVTSFIDDYKHQKSVDEIKMKYVKKHLKGGLPSFTNLFLFIGFTGYLLFLYVSSSVITFLWLVFTFYPLIALLAEEYFLQKEKKELVNRYAKKQNKEYRKKILFYLIPLALFLSGNILFELLKKDVFNWTWLISLLFLTTIISIRTIILIRIWNQTEYLGQKYEKFYPGTDYYVSPRNLVARNTLLGIVAILVLLDFFTRFIL